MKENKAEIFRTLDIDSTELAIYHCGRHKCLPGHSFGPVKREYYLFHYIAQGKGMFQNEQEIFHLTQNQGFLIRPNELTFYKADENEPWEYYFVGFHGIRASQIVDSIDWKDNCIVSPHAAGAVLDCFKDMYINAGAASWAQLRMTGELYALFSYLVKESNKNDHKPHTADGDNVVASALNFIKDKFALAINIGDIASFCNVDRSNLFRKFKKELNISPQDFLLNYRLDRAAAYMKETKLTSYEVALAVGMQDYPNFCKHFKRKFLETPIEYRKNLQ